MLGYLYVIQRSYELPTLYGSVNETWCVTPRAEHGLRVSENTVVRKTFGPKRNEVTGVCISRVGRGEGHTEFWWGNQRESEHLKDLGID